jgi:hypothetical protein
VRCLTLLLLSLDVARTLRKHDSSDASSVPQTRGTLKLKVLATVTSSQVAEQAETETQRTTLHSRSLSERSGSTISIIKSAAQQFRFSSESSIWGSLLVKVALFTKATKEVAEVRHVHNANTSYLYALPPRSTYMLKWPKRSYLMRERCISRDPFLLLCLSRYLN